MGRPLWFVNLLKRVFPGASFAAGLTRFPPLGRLVEWGLFRGDDIIYLPRDSAVRQVIQVGQTVETPTDLVMPSQVVEHFIEQAQYHWLMDFCICRASNHCEDYPIELGCLFLGKAVLGINPRLGRRVSREEALAHVRRCREAGLVHMIGRNRLDSVWLGATPGHRLLTICNCCPCCCLWRLLPRFGPAIGDKVARMPGVTLRVTHRCVGCGACTQGVCFVNAIHLQEGRAVIDDSCRGCGRCVEVCPQKAIELDIDDASSVEMAIARLSTLIDVT